MENNQSVKAATASHQTQALWKEYVKAAVVAIILALFIRTFVAQAFKIPSESMLNTLKVGDHLLINKLVYRFWEPERGDVIVFQYPLDKSRDFVKRVIGLPGETISMKDNVIYINGKPIKEPYTVYDNSLLFHGMESGFKPFHIPEGYLFMMGDNRFNSQDSRVWGPLDEKLIHGKVFIIHWAWRDNSWGVRWERIGKLMS